MGQVGRVGFVDSQSPHQWQVSMMYLSPHVKLPNIAHSLSETNNSQDGPSNYSKINELIVGLKREFYCAKFTI